MEAHPVKHSNDQKTSYTFSSSSGDDDQGRLEGYPIDDDVVATLERTVVPDPIPSNSQVVLPYEVSKYEENGYDRWHYGPGVKRERRLELLPVDSRSASATDAKRLLNFFIITDPTDLHASGPYNADLVVPLSAEMRGKIRRFGV